MPVNSVNLIQKYPSNFSGIQFKQHNKNFPQQTLKNDEFNICYRQNSRQDSFLTKKNSVYAKDLYLTFRGTTNKSNAKSAFEKTSDNFELTSDIKRGQIVINNKIFVRSNTNMFRIDLDWHEFKNYLKQHFKAANRVNTYIYGCSTGEEAYTMSILLQDTFKNRAENFFPIFAKDIDNDTINKNRQNQRTRGLHVYNAEIPARYSLDLDDKELKKYMKIIGFDEYLLQNVTSPIQFSVANILEDVENIDDRYPSILMCRNMWPYINPKEYEDFAKRLYDKLKTDSIVVIGSHDCNGEPGIKDTDLFPKALLKAGFVEPECIEYMPEFINDIEHPTIFVKK